MVNLLAGFLKKYKKNTTLTIDEVMSAYRETSKLYPYSPSMSIWRSWELAAYRRYILPEPILDVGCGDGLYFKLVWPTIRNVYGIDINPASVLAAQNSGVYKSVHTCSAIEMPFESASFSSVFANCSLEHMDNLPGVLRSIERVLKPGGNFLCSVVTDKFIEWSSLPQLAEAMGDSGGSLRIRNEYLAYHHLVTAFPADGWIAEFEAAGFIVEDHIPILPELLGRLDLFIDTLWHLPRGSSELGDVLVPYFRKWKNFPETIGELMQTLLRAESDWNVACGAVFSVRKKG